MKDLYDLTQRRQLLQRYLNAETTAAEERRLLDFYSQNSDSLTPEEEDVRLLLLSSRQTDEFLPSEEKAVEFGQRLRQLVIDMTGYDPHEFWKDPKNFEPHE